MATNLTTQKPKQQKTPVVEIGGERARAKTTKPAVKRKAVATPGDVSD